MASNQAEKITMNSAFGMAVSALLPIAKTVFTPIAIMGREGAENLMSHARRAVQYAKEEIEDIVAEAKFERLKKQLDKEMIMEEGSHDGK